MTTNHRRRQKTTLRFITSNANKLAEVRAILLQQRPNRNEDEDEDEDENEDGHERARERARAGSIDIRSLSIPDLPEIQAATVEEVATDKCRRAVEWVSAKSQPLFYLFLFSFSSSLLL
jgi:hypothetical protein